MHRYDEYLPIGSVGLFVHRIWYFEQDSESSSELIVPDGRPELILHLGNPYREMRSSIRQPKILFAGQLTRPLELYSEGRTAFWGVRFRPDGARGFLQDSVASVTDRRVCMESRGNGELSELARKLEGPTSDLEKVRQICETLNECLSDSEPDALVREKVDFLMRHESAEPQSRLSDRQLQRRFKREVGISMRMFKAIRRFRSVFDRVSQDNNESWVARALESGYFDQSQLSRDFQRFLGVSPREWISRQSGLGQALGDSIDQELR